MDAVLREGEEVVTALEHAQGVGQAVQVEVQQTTQEHEKEKNMHAHVKQQEVHADVGWVGGLFVVRMNNE